MYYVYLLYSESLNRYYIGFSRDLIGRLARHNRSTKGYTSVGKPWAIVYYESFELKKEALKREKQLKGWKNINRIEDLIRKSSSAHPD